EGHRLRPRQGRARSHSRAGREDRGEMRFHRGLCRQASRVSGSRRRGRPEPLKNSPLKNFAAHVTAALVISSCSQTYRVNRQERSMTARLNPYGGTHASLVKPLIEYGQTIQQRLEPKLAELVKIRASQINGCAICLNMHASEARKQGESEERIR